MGILRSDDQSSVLKHLGNGYSAEKKNFEKGLGRREFGVFQQGSRGIIAEMRADSGDSVYVGEREAERGLRPVRLGAAFHCLDDLLRRGEAEDFQASGVGRGNVFSAETHNRAVELPEKGFPNHR